MQTRRRSTHLQIGSHAQIVVPDVVVLAQQRIGQLDGQTLAVVLRLVLAHAVQDGRRIGGDALVLRVQQLGQRRGGALALDQLGALFVGGQLAQDAGGDALRLGRGRTNTIRRLFS